MRASGEEATPKAPCDRKLEPAFSPPQQLAALTATVKWLGDSFEQADKAGELWKLGETVGLEAQQLQVFAGVLRDVADQILPEKPAAPVVVAPRISQKPPSELKRIGDEVAACLKKKRITLYSKSESYDSYRLSLHAGGGRLNFLYFYPSGRWQLEMHPAPKWEKRFREAIAPLLEKHQATLKIEHK